MLNIAGGKQGNLEEGRLAGMALYLIEEQLNQIIA